MISDNDLDAMFDTGDFAQNAEFTVSGSTVTVPGYFTAGSDAVEQYGMQIEAVEPSFTCRQSLIAGVTRNTAVEIGGVDYTVVRVQKAGTGVSVCYLKTA